MRKLFSHAALAVALGIFLVACEGQSLPTEATLGDGGALTVAGKPAKVEICHLNSASDTINGLGSPDRKWAFGKILSVSEPAVPSHEGHGDATDFRVEEGDQGWINLHLAAERDGLRIWKHAECFFEVFP